MLRVQDLDAAIAFYRDVMGLEPAWRDGEMAGLEFPDTPGTELVLHTNVQIPRLDVNYLVHDVVAEVAMLSSRGCSIVVAPFAIAVGNCAVVQDPFGNHLTLVDMTTGPRRTNLSS